MFFRRGSDRGAPARRYPAMGLGLMLAFLAFWYMWSARLSDKAAQVGHVPDVSPETLAQMISQGKPVVLEFYTSSCPWCAKIEPELANVGETYRDQLFVAKMNAERYGAEASKYRISAVPTLVLFDSMGSPVALAAGYRDSDGIVEILRNYSFID